MPENQNPHDAESLLNELEITVDPLNTGTFKSKQLKDHALLQTFHLIQDFWERFRRLPLENATLESEHRTWSKWQSFQEGWEQADESVRETILKEDYYGLLRSFIEKAQSRAMKAKIDQTVIKFFADPLAKQI